MKKGLLIFLTASITFIVSMLLVVSLLLVIGRSQNGRKAELGERYDSEKLDRFDNNGWASETIQDFYDQVFQEAKNHQFVIHQKTAVAIAEAVIKEAYPDDTFRLGAPLELYGALYYEKEDCWVVLLNNKDYSNARVKAVYVYVDVNSGAVKAVIPLRSFGGNFDMI